MHVIEDLINRAIADNRLLIANQGKGDRVAVARDIEFVLYAKNEERARLVADFIRDNQYGRPSVARVDNKGAAAWQVLVIINAPASENVVHTLSAFMVFLAQLYDLEYKGWGSNIPK